jgi:hypothetical protein
LSDKIIGNDTDPLSFVTPVHGNSFNFTSITIQETIDALNQIKSPWLDEICTRLLKDATNIIAGQLVNPICTGGAHNERTPINIYLSFLNKLSHLPVIS